MRSVITNILTQDKLPLHTYIWMPDESIELKGVLLIVHGSVEHAKRYKRFAQFLNKNGFGVYAFDLRGHGKTTALDSPNFAHISYKDGWEQLLNDIHVVHQQMVKDYPNCSKFLFGHSMGSFLVRDYMANYRTSFKGLILSGTSYGENREVKLLLTVAKVLTVFYHPTHKSKFLHRQIYGTLNKKMDNPQSSVDFISSDKQEIQKYLDDALCGQIISIGYAHEMGKGLMRANAAITIRNTPKDLPILIISGEDDPVGGDKGIQLINLYKAYKAEGIKNVSIHLYKNARHELLNEINRGEVMEDILKWLNYTIKTL